MALGRYRRFRESDAPNRDSFHQVRLHDWRPQGEARGADPRADPPSPAKHLTAIPQVSRTPMPNPADLLAGIDVANNYRAIGVAAVEVVVPIGPRARAGPILPLAGLLSPINRRRPAAFRHIRRDVQVICDVSPAERGGLRRAANGVEWSGRSC